MKLKPKIAITDYFSEIEDPRVDRTKEHQLIDILTIAVCAVICGADNWVAIEAFGHSKYKWLKKFLNLPNGIPSHDTFSRVFAQIDSTQFQDSFLKWIKSINKITSGEIVAIDGKTLRPSYKKGGKQGAIHMVNAWAASQRLVLGQRKVDEKSNEITAIPELIKLLQLKGCIVTIDAMGCQKKIVDLLVQKQADYVIAVKENQGHLYQSIQQLFQQAFAVAMRSIIACQFEGFEADTHSSKEFSHGREEIRHYVRLSPIENQVKNYEKWSNLKSIGRVESVRTVDGKTTVETRYYITTLINDVKRMSSAIRGHWGIENSLHWVLDVAFQEDNCRVRKINSPQNFAVLRQIAAKLLNGEKSAKGGLKTKRLRAGWDNSYLEKVLGI